MRLMRRAGQDALVVVVPTGEDVLLTRVLRAALACGEYAVETTLRLLSGVIPNAAMCSHNAVSADAHVADAGTGGPPIRQPDPTEVSETIRFALDGQAYEIDLKPEDADRLRAAFRPYIAAGRRIEEKAAPVTHGGRPPRPDPTHRGRDTAVIREWAHAHGHQISHRGRIPTRVLQAYRAARQ